MRTTLTLEEDVAVMLEQRRRQTGASWKSVVNEVMRKGLQVGDERQAGEGGRFETESVDHGRAKLQSVDDIGGILEILEEAGK